MALFASASHESFDAVVNHTYSVPMFGTLLGLEREGDLIRCDHDLDFYTPLGQSLDVVPPGLVKSYEEKLPTGVLTQTAFQHAERRRLFIDVFSLIENGDEVMIRMVHRRKPKGKTTYKFPRRWFEELESVEYEWCEVLMPVHRRELLAAIYGSGWQTKQCKWRHPRD